MKRAVIHYNIIFFSLLVILNLRTAAYSFDMKGDGCSTDCRQCHKIKREEAADILKDFVQLKVISVEEGPVRGMWEVKGEVQGRSFPVYLHYSKKYFFTGNIIDIESKQVISNSPLPEAAPKEIIDVSKIPLDEAIIIGKPSAPNRVIVFDDPDCPFCRNLHAEIKEVVSKRDDIVFYIKLFPLVELHPQAYDKSKAIVCARSLKMLDDAFSGKDIPSPKCETREIDDNIELASKLGISGTPTLILRNGTIVPGYAKADEIISMIESVKQETGAGK